MLKSLDRVKEELGLFSDEQPLITVSRKDLEALVYEIEKSNSQKKVISREVQFNRKNETLYCIKDGENHVFSFRDYSFSLSVVNTKQLEEMMKYESGMLGQEPIKSQMVDVMKNMMKELKPSMRKKMER